MPYLSAASRFVAPTQRPDFLRGRRLPLAVAEPRKPGEDALAAAETSDTLSLSAPAATAETTTINVGTLRVTMPSTCEEEAAAKASDPTKEIDPPACSAEC